MMQAQFCGLDFGTSNSTVSISDGISAALVPLESAHQTLPSAVFWDSEGLPPVFGRAAIASYVGGEDGRLMRGIKSTLGSTLIDEKTKVGNKLVSFRTVLGAYLGHLKARLDAHVGSSVERVVIGRPVHFVDNDPAADARAQEVLAEIAREVGFRDIAFQFEPIAAALQYEQGVAREELVLIVDIGGGTSDFSILRVSPQRAKLADRSADILANDGIRLGGTDFDRVLSLAEVMPHLGFNTTTGKGRGIMPKHYYLDLATWHRINMLYTQRTLTDLKALRFEADEPVLIDRLAKVVRERHGHSLAMAVEAVKIALSDADHARLMLSVFTAGPNPMVSRERLETALGASMERIRGALRSILAQAGLPPTAIGTVFMTGGSSGLPILRACVGQVLPGVPIATGDMLGSVGAGLALDAVRKFA